MRIAAVAFLAAAASCGDSAHVPGEIVVRIGHFPNITHAHGLIAHGLSRQEKGWFEERLGPGAKVEWYTYNAGPSAMEALLAGSIDATYVGPNPALNTYIRSKGTEVRVLAGATRGGAALVVQGDGRIAGPGDFKGRKVATPQFGNTQDVSCRAWLVAKGYAVTQTGGDVHVIPTPNPEQMALFQAKELDAVWTVEPWVSRLELRAGGRIMVEEPEAMTTLLVGSVQLVSDRPQLAKRLADAHRELTAWIVAHPAEAKAAVRAELRAETRDDVPEELVDHCWKRLSFDDAISTADFTTFVAAAQSVGYLKDAGDLSRLVARLP